MTFFCLSWALHVTSCPLHPLVHVHTLAHTQSHTEMAINQPDSDTFGRCSVGKIKLKNTVNCEHSEHGQPKLKVHFSLQYSVS